MGIAVPHDAAASTNANAAQIQISKTRGLKQGQLLLVAIYARAGGTIHAPAGWTLVRNEVLLPAGQVFQLYWKVAAKEPASWTWQINGSTGDGVVVGAYSGAAA